MEAGELISGKYRLQRVLGAGSMGSVWAARNELTNRDFAIKFLLPELSKNQEAVNRFFLEARACGQIRHPAIVDVYDMGQAEDGSPYLVMELLEGEGFDARLTRAGTMRPVDACRYVALIARGLEEAHTRGLIHRDLKPGNIFFSIDKSGDVFPKVLDFGISKETSSEHFDCIKTSTGTVLGSPAYMSPEQAKGELDVDARTDVWALGVILYEALTGQLPFDANNYNALMLVIITEPHRPVLQMNPQVPVELANLIDHCLQKDRDVRMPTAGELGDALERVYVRLTDTPLNRPDRALSIPPPDGTTQNGWFKVRTRHGSNRVSPAVIVGAALAAIGLVGGGIAVSRSTASSSPVPAAERIAGAANAIVAQAESRATETMAEAKTQAADERARKAKLEAEAATQQKEDLENSARTSGVPRKPEPSNPVHGGVDDPGF